jgi:DNA-binding CsgD family transcriptional regulator
MMTVFAGGPRDQVLPHARRLLADGRLAEEDPADSQAMWHLIATLGWCDDHAAAREAVDLAFDEARRRGSVFAFALASMFRARHALWTGPVGDAVHDAQAAVDVLPGDSVYRLSAGYCLVSGLLELGESDRAATALAALGTWQAPPFFAAWRKMAVGRVAAGRGDHERALAEFRAVGRLHAELLIDNPAVLPWRSEAALAALALGDPDSAARMVAAELRVAEHFGAPRPIGVARRAAGLGASGGASLLRAAVDVLQDSGIEVEHARALADLGAAIRRAGRPAQARPLLRAALDQAIASGTQRVAAQAGAELRLAGGRPAARVVGPADDLTPGERRVVELAVRGHSNRQIASTLFITVKAVEWHLGNAYRKLGIRTRADLSRAISPPTPEAP